MQTTAHNIAESINASAVELHGRLSRGGGNVVLSPLAIHSALAMVYAGARRKTARKLAKRLGMPVEYEQLPGPYGALIRMVDATNGPQWTLASALWARSGLAIHEDFRRTLESDYGADLSAADFADPIVAADAINRWVASRTGGRIDGLASPDSFTSLTVFILICAVYFKDAWRSPFEPDQTVDAPFHAERGGTTVVRMMHQSEYFTYAETRDAQVVSLPYRAAESSMLILLPRQKDGLRSMERSLTAQSLEGIEGRLAHQNVDLHLPRFRIDRTVCLREALSGMGLRVAFDPQEADFSGIADVRPLWLEEALHRAFIDVNEEGTEAAAATMLGGRGGFRDPDIPVEFRADHPFLFLIRHEPTGTITFIGRFAGPLA